MAGESFFVYVAKNARGRYHRSRACPNIASVPSVPIRIDEPVRYIRYPNPCSACASALAEPAPAPRELPVQTATRLLGHLRAVTHWTEVMLSRRAAGMELTDSMWAMGARLASVANAAIAQAEDAVGQLPYREVT